jgi:hypothetical protein
MYIRIMDRIILKKKCNAKKKHTISIWRPYNVYKPIPIAKNPILLHNFIDVKHGWIEHPRELVKF